MTAREKLPEVTQFTRVTAILAIGALELGRLGETPALSAPQSAWENLELAYEQVGLLLARPRGVQ
jgi:hypothetical protein